MSRFNIVVRVLSVALLSSAVVGHAEVNVSITITGSIDELVPLMQQLKEYGIGAEEGKDADKVKLEMHSVVSADEAYSVDAPAPRADGAISEAPVKPDPVLELVNANAQPATVTRNDRVTVTIRAYDRDRRIDTIGMKVYGAPVSADLYDNGEGYDRTPQDGTWTGWFVVPEDMAPGEHSVRITAFDVNGDRIMVTDANGREMPLTTDVAFVVK